MLPIRPALVRPACARKREPARQHPHHEAPRILDNVPNERELEVSGVHPAQGVIHVEFGVPGPTSGRVHIAVYDVRGRRVATLQSGAAPPGRHAVTWSGDRANRLAGGVYFVRMVAGNFRKTQKVVVVR